MTSSRVIVPAYRFLAARKRAVLWCVGLFLAAGFALLPLTRPAENIASMIPDGGEGLAEDFMLLGKAPFTNRVFIAVTTPEHASPGTLAAAGDALAAALPPDLFPEVRGGPSIMSPTALMTGMLDLLPALFTPEDLARAEALATPQAVRSAMAENARLLSSAEGMGMTGVVREDPLNLRRLALEKLASLRISGSVRLEHGRFMSEDARSMLLIARPSPAMTDADGSRRVMEAFERAKVALPPGFSAELTGGHRHTLANADAIRSDMVTVLAASSAGLGLLFLLGLRSRSGLIAFALPFCILPPAALATKAVFGSVSGITLGFGAVLMGVAVDYSIYVHFALRGLPGETGDILARVSRPVLYGWATSMACFASLFFSGVPGVREMAFFSLTGLTLALGLSLFVLPLLTAPEAGPGTPQVVTELAQGRSLPAGAALAVIGLALAGGLFFGREVRFDSDLRALSASGRELAGTEAAMRAAFGEVRERAMVFASGQSLDKALTANGLAFAELAALRAQGVVSLAPVLPPSDVQRANMDRWRGFMNPDRTANLRRLVESEATALGFVPGAFEPFVARLSKENFAAATPERLRETGLGEALDLLLARDGEGHLAITLAPDSPELLKRLDRPEAGVRPVSQTVFAAGLTRVIGEDFTRLTLVALGGNLALLLLFLRSARGMLLSMVPTAVGCACLFGVMGALDKPLNLFGVIAVPLVIGIGVDYGVFMTMEGAGSRGRATTRAVILAGLSTVAGFGALALARHPALHSMGVTVLVGISGAVAAACMLVAPLRAKK
jgi:predicted exporter